MNWLKSLGKILNPESKAKSYLDQGNYFTNIGEYAGAINCYNKTIEIAPNLCEAYFKEIKKKGC